MPTDSTNKAADAIKMNCLMSERMLPKLHVNLGNVFHPLHDLEAQEFIQCKTPTIPLRCRVLQEFLPAAVSY